MQPSLLQKEEIFLPSERDQVRVLLKPEPEVDAKFGTKFLVGYGCECNISRDWEIRVRPYKLNSQFIVTARIRIFDSDTKFRVQSSTEFMLCQQ